VRRSPINTTPTSATRYHEKQQRRSIADWKPAEEGLDSRKRSSCCGKLLAQMLAQVIEKNGRPGEIRTPDPRFRNSNRAADSKVNQQLISADSGQVRQNPQPGRNQNRAATLTRSKPERSQRLMYDWEAVLEAARSIRPFLGNLLGPKSTAVDNELARCLDEAQRGREVDDLILRLLSRYEKTGSWMGSFLERKCPPELAHLYDPSPGTGAPVRAEKFHCPEGDYVWYRRTAGVAVPRCPTHFLTLEPAVHRWDG
jgi:hypothetical protein